jgi:polyhydroxybutyrate depolymerase
MSPTTSPPAWILPVLVLVAACAGPDLDDAPGPDPSDTDGVDLDDTAAPSVPDDTGDPSVPPDPACTAHAVPRVIEVQVGGTTRSALLAGPAALPDAPLPLVLNFHGYSDDPLQQEGFSLMSEHAPAAGYVVAYPQGTGGLAGWNAGACCGSAALSGVDDVAFTEALIDAIADVACIDTERVYAVGYSNGGFFAHKLACELSERIAGIASVAGVIGIDDCTPTRDIPVLQIHGTSDLIVPYDGNVFLDYPSVDDTVEAWRDRHGCVGPSTVEFDQGDATCIAWEGCTQPVSLCTIDGGGHTWPGGTAPAIRGKVSRDLDATAGMWDFFERAAVSHPLR